MVAPISANLPLFSTGAKPLSGQSCIRDGESQSHGHLADKEVLMANEYQACLTASFCF